MSKPCLVLVTISLFHVYVEILRTLKLLITASRKNFTRLLNENDFLGEFRRICHYFVFMNIVSILRSLRVFIGDVKQNLYSAIRIQTSE